MKKKNELRKSCFVCMGDVGRVGAGGGRKGGGGARHHCPEFSELSKS